MTCCKGDYRGNRLEKWNRRENKSSCGRKCGHYRNEHKLACGGSAFSNDRKNGIQHNTEAAALANQNPLPPERTAPRIAAAVSPAAAMSDTTFSLLVPFFYARKNIVNFIARLVP